MYWSNTKIHNIITSGNFNKLLRWLINLRKYQNLKIKMHCLVLKQNYKNLNNIRKIAEKLRFDIKFIYTIPDWYIDLKTILASFSEIYRYNDIEIEDIPMCIKDFWNSSITIDKKTTIIDWQIKQFDTDFASNRSEKVYVEKCNNFKLKNNCSGIYKNYLNLFWQKEFF